MLTQLRRVVNINADRFGRVAAYDFTGQSLYQLTTNSAKSGTLSARTDNDTGTCTLASDHGITTGDKVDVYWDGGARRSMTVGSVSGTSVPIDGGSGDNLPASSTAVTVCVQAQMLVEFISEQIEVMAVEVPSRCTLIFMNVDDGVALQTTYPVAGTEINCIDTDDLALTGYITKLLFSTDQTTPQTIYFGFGSRASLPTDEDYFNTAPVVTCSGSDVDFTQGDAATVIDNGITVTDATDTVLVSATVTISTGYESGVDVLSVVDASGITGSWNSSTGVLTLSGESSVANYQAILRTVKFYNASLSPSETTRVITFIVNDGLTNSNSSTKNVTVTDLVEGPVVTATGGSTSYTENDAALAIDSGITVTDATSSTIDSGTVSITGNFQSGQDVLSMATQNGISASYNSSTGVLTLTGTGVATAFWQTALRTVKYNNTSDNPNTSSRTISFQLDDGTDVGNTATKTVTVSAVNDAPVVTTSGGTTSFTENGGAVAIDASLTVTDADNSNLTGGTVSITSNFQSAQDVLAFTNQNGISGSYNSSSGVLTLSGTSSVANYQTALRSITYNNTSEAPNTSTRTITFVVNDGTTDSSSATKDVSVSAVNDAPVVTLVSNTLTVDQDSTDNAVSGVSVSDADNSSLTVTLTSTHGTLKMTTLTGLTFTSGDGTDDSTMEFSGTTTNINNALATLSYTPTGSYSGSDSIDITVDDGTDTDSDSITVTVTAAATFFFTSDGGASEVYRYIASDTTTIATVTAGPSPTGYSVTAQDSALVTASVDSSGNITLDQSLDTGYGVVGAGPPWYWWTDEESDMKLDVTIEATDGSQTATQVQRLIFEPVSSTGINSLGGTTTNITAGGWFPGDGSSYSHTIYIRYPLSVSGSFDIVVDSTLTCTVNTSDSVSAVQDAIGGAFTLDGGFSPARVFDRNGFREIYIRIDGGSTAGSTVEINNNTLS